MDETPFICHRCSRVHPTCCRTDKASSNKCFPLSEAERDRLVPHAAALNVPAAETEENTKEFHALMQILFPGRTKDILRAFPPGGTHLRLPLAEDGACLFLREDGCFLPRDARPWYCQLFPLWVRDGFFDRFLPEACLFTQEAKRLEDVFRAMHMSREEAGTMYNSLCRDWGMEDNDRI